MDSVIFDATILGNNYYKNNQRSGIFQCTKELFDTIYKNNMGKLSIYADIHSYEEVKLYFKKYYPALCIYTNGNKFSKLIQKIECSLKMRKSKISNIFFRKINSLLIYIVSFIININKRIPCDLREILSTYNVFFSPMFAIPKFVRKYKLKNVLIIYDLIPLKMADYSGGIKGWFGAVYNSLNTSDYYFTISEFTKTDFLDSCGSKIDKEKVYNTYIGVSDRFYPVEDKTLFEKIKNKYKIPSGKYLFSLCNIENRKNLKMQVTSFINFLMETKVDDICYLMGGGVSSFHTLLNELKDLIPNELLNKIQYIGYIDDEDLPLLYSNALWFTFTSKFEGFGLPPLEAMKCGCPVVTSNRTSLPEICGDAAIIVDSDSKEEHVSAYKQMYFNETVRKFYIEKGFSQVKKFDWNKIVRHMYELFNLM